MLIGARPCVLVRAAGVQGGRPPCCWFGDDLIVRFAAASAGEFEAVADLDALDRLDAHQGAGQLGVQPAVALVLADAVAEKFGGDSVTETRRNVRGYLDNLVIR